MIDAVVEKGKAYARVGDKFASGDEDFGERRHDMHYDELAEVIRREIQQRTDAPKLFRYFFR